jgi:hypothetical protein
VIVLDGLLFEAHLDGSEIKLKPQSHLQVRAMSEADVYIVDVVTKDYFKTFFDEIEKFHDELTSLISRLDLPEDYAAGATKAWRDHTLSPDTAAAIAMATQHRPTTDRRSKIRLVSASEIQGSLR